MDTHSWTWHVDRAGAHLELDQSCIYLNGEGPPWHLVDSVKSGGVHRMGISVSASFTASHAPSGLTFRWHLDYEDRDANGSGHFQMNILRLRSVLTLLQAPMRAEFALILGETLRKVRERIAEFRTLADESEAGVNSLGALLSEYGP